MKQRKEIKIIEVNSRTNGGYLEELWFNAKYGGEKGTQLEWWIRENWIIAVKGWVDSLLKQKIK